jgi:methyl-accepting chemotaxis protein
MTIKAEPFRISIRGMMLAASLLVCLGILTGYLFTVHTLSATQERLGLNLSKQTIQLNQYHAIKTGLIQLEAFVESLHNDRPLTSVPKNRLASLLSEISGTWDDFIDELPPDTYQRAGEADQLSAMLRDIGRAERYNGLGTRAARQSLRNDIIATMGMLEDLSAAAQEARSHAIRSALNDIQQHENELHLAVTVLGLSMLAIFGFIYSNLVSPLRKLGKLAVSAGKDEAGRTSLHMFEPRLSELAELRDLIIQMVDDLTISHRFIALGSNTMLDLTHTASNISSQVRSGVIEETAISKDIFSDLREMHLGNQQMQEALAQSMTIIVSASSQDCLDKEDISDLHNHLQLISDITQGEFALGEDLGHVLDGFDDLVRNRMSLASELERLTKKMSVCAEELAFRSR